MGKITSRRTLIEALGGNVVTRTHHGILTLDGWDEWLDKAIADLTAAKVPYEVKLDGLEFDTNKFVRKPLVHKITHGIITFTSQGHRFTDMQGQVTRADWKVSDITYTPSGFILQGCTPGHEIEYKLANEVETEKQDDHT